MALIPSTCSCWVTQMAGRWPFDWPSRRPTRSPPSRPSVPVLPTPDSSSCAQQGRTARVMLANGTLDPINPYEGGKVTIFGFGYRGTALSSRASADQFAQRNGITTAPAATQLPHRHEKDPTSVDSLTWSIGDHTPIAVFYTVHGGGHVVPQPAFRYPRMLGRTAGDLDAPSSALRFFGLSQ